jgi:hypothetical protein
MTRLNAFKKFARAGIVAVALTGSAAAVTTPAYATNNSPQVSFSLSFGNGYGFKVTNHRHHKRSCASYRQIRWEFQRHGYRNIHIQGGRGPWAIVKATKHRWSYKYRVNRCNGRMKLINKHRVRHWGNDNWGHGGWGRGHRWN